MGVSKKKQKTDSPKVRYVVRSQSGVRYSGWVPAHLEVDEQGRKRFVFNDNALPRVGANDIIVLNSSLG